MQYKYLTVLMTVGTLALSACPKSDEPSGDDEAGDANADTSTDGGDKGSADETGDGTMTTDESGTDGVFVPTSDLGMANTCDPWAQDCPDGEKCAAWSSSGDTWDANKCVPLEGEGITGDECTYNGAATGTDTCDVGFMCYYTNEEGIGSCIPLCSGSPDDPFCPDNFNCSISNDGSLLLCVYSCNPLLQDCEQDGTGCYWDGALFNCDPIAGGIPEGEPCGYINDCDAGNICLDAEAVPDCASSACCAGYCDLDDPQCQLPGSECIAFFDEGTAPPGFENVGICAIPG